MRQKFIKISIYLLIILGVIFVVLAFKNILTENNNRFQTISDKSGLALSNLATDTSTSTAEYRLIIPSIEVDMEIIFSDSEEYGLAHGAWHLPGSGAPDNPDDYKNIIISAHRYLYTSGPNTFFNLDKVKTDDEIIVNWAGKEYRYKIAKIYVVEPSEVSILEDTGQEKLTLFTCTPVFTTDQRLVVEAYPI